MIRDNLPLLLVALVIALLCVYLPDEGAPEQRMAPEALPPDVVAQLNELSRGPEPAEPPKEMEPGMSWVVSGAGDSAYNGTYVESGTYNGQPAYTNGSKWLWWDTLLPGWVLSAATGDISPDYYNGASLPGSWSVSLGTAPAPTVAEAVDPPPAPGETTSLQRGFVPQAGHWGFWNTTVDQEVKPGRFLDSSPVSDKIIYGTRHNNMVFPIYDVGEDTWVSGMAPGRPGLETYATNRIAFLDGADESHVCLIAWTNEWDGLSWTQFTFAADHLFVYDSDTWAAPQAFDEVSNFALDGAGSAWFVGVWNDAGDRAYDLYSIDLSDCTVALEKAWRVTADALALSGAQLAGHEPLVFSGNSGEFYLLRTDGVSTYVHSLSTTAFELTGNPIPVTGVQRAARDETTGYLHVGTENADIGRWDPSTGQGWACMRAFGSERLYYSEGVPFGAACV